MKSFIQGDGNYKKRTHSKTKNRMSPVIGQFIKHPKFQKFNIDPKWKRKNTNSYRKELESNAVPISTPFERYTPSERRPFPANKGYFITNETTGST